MQGSCCGTELAFHVACSNFLATFLFSTGGKKRKLEEDKREEKFLEKQMKLQENLLEKVCSTFLGGLQKILAETQNPKSNLRESTHTEPFFFVFF